MGSDTNKETSTTKTSLDIFLTNINKNQCVIESISYDITDHYPVVFRVTKNMIRHKTEASKRRCMSVFNKKRLFEKN